MKLFGSLRMLCLTVLLGASTLPAEANALNAVVNYNATTMWMYNYFRAYLCDGVFPEAVCDSLAGADQAATDTEGFDGEAEPEESTNTGSNGGAGDGILGLGIFGGLRGRRNL